MSLPLCGKELEVQSYPTPATGRPYPQNGQGRTGGTRVYLPLCGEELKDQSYPTPQTGRPYPPNGPGRTGGPRVYLPLCGGDVEVQSYPTPHRAYLSPKWPRQNRRDSGVSADVWRGAGSAIIPDSPHGASLSPKRPKQDRGPQVYLPLCGGSQKLNRTGHPHGRPYPTDGLGRTTGTRVSRALCEEELKVQSYQTHFPTGRPYTLSGKAGPE